MGIVGDDCVDRRSFAKQIELPADRLPVVRQRTSRQREGK
jgi:hypothetical protein